MRTRKEFQEQIVDKSFAAWWSKEEINFPLILTIDAKKIFQVGRSFDRNENMKLRTDLQKERSKLRKMQSKLDKLKSEVV